MQTIVFLGSEIKLKVEIEPIGGHTMDDFDFSCEFYCLGNQPVLRTNAQMERSEDAGYIALLDTRELGVGQIRCKITGNIPDTYAGNDWLRTEVAIIDTGVYITRG